MRKLFAFLAVLSVILAPTLHLWCEGSCDESSVNSTCHHHQAPAHAFTSAHSCETHAQPPAVIVKSVSAPMPLSLVSVPIDVNVDAARVIGRALMFNARPLDSSPPLLTLRI